MDRRISKAEARRRAKAIRENASTETPQVIGDNLRRLQDFRAGMAPREHREQVRQAVVAVCGRSTHITGKASFVKALSDVSALATWAARNGKSLDWQALMDHSVIHDFARAPHGRSSARSHRNRVVRLQRLASSVNPGPTAPPRLVAGRHSAVKPPYTEAEDRALIRMAKGQADQVRARRLQLAIGLSRGCGASSPELRKLETPHIVDRGSQGIDVTLGTGPTLRTVPVRRDYEPLVREGLHAAPHSGPIFGTGKNAINQLIDSADVLSTDVPKLEISRLRTSYLSELMDLAVPLSTLLKATGLQSARVFADIWQARRNAGQLTADDLESTR